MWLEDLRLKGDDGDYYFDRDELESLCDELEIKLEEGRAELTRREEEAND
jgi:hypothetical protein